MFRTILLGALFIVSSAASTLADPAADVQAGAKKLTESGNYSWKSTVEGGFGAGATEGKTDKGLTYLTVTLRDTPIEVVMKGDKSAVKLADGWKTLAEAAGGDATQPNPGRFISRIVQNYKAPAVEAEELAGQSKDLQSAEGVISGTLSEEGAKALLTFGRRGGNANAAAPQISNAKGTVKFWLKDGALSKMAVNVKGSVSFNGQDRDIDRTTTVEIKDVGTTKIEVPEEARTKAGLDK